MVTRSFPMTLRGEMVTEWNNKHKNAVFIPVVKIPAD